MNGKNLLAFIAGTTALVLSGLACSPSQEDNRTPVAVSHRTPEGRKTSHVKLPSGNYIVEEFSDRYVVRNESGSGFTDTMVDDGKDGNLELPMHPYAKAKSYQGVYDNIFAELGKRD